MANFKPTLKDPMSPQSEKFEKDYKKTMITTAPNIHLKEIDSNLNENEFSLKKKIFSLPKMESLVFSDPKLSSVYEEMSENGEQRFGYHYNETIMNMLFNDYVLNSPIYLQKYKMAIPKEKKRRDKSGINTLKKAGQKKMAQSGLPKQSTVDETNINMNNTAPTKVIFLINEKNNDLFAYFPEEIHNGEFATGYSQLGQHSAVHPDYAKESRPATPEEYQNLKTELEEIGYNLEILNGMQESTSAGSAGGGAGYVGYAGPAAFSSKGDLMGNGKKKGQKIKKPIWKGGTIIQESNYLTDPRGFEKYVAVLNEESDAAYISRNGSNTYGSVDNMSSQNQKIIKKDIQSGKLDTNHNIKDGIALQEQGVGKITTVEQIKALGRKLTKEDIPNLAGEALYKLAVKLAGQILPLGWDDLPDTNSMWDYINENGGMTYEELVKNVKEACNDRLSEEGVDFDMLNEKAKSKSQQRFMGMVNAYKNGELDSDEVSGDIERAADSMTDTEVDDFASTKHKGLPEKLDEFLSLHDTVEYVSDRNGEDPFEMHGTKWQFVNARYPDGKIDIGVYMFGHDLVYDYSRWKEEYNINENINETMKENLIDFDIPEWAVSALINADESGLTDEDQAKLNVFVDGVVKQYGNANFMLGNIDGEDNLGFKSINDIDNLGNNVYRLYINPTNNIKEDTQTMIQNNGSSMSNKAQATGDVSNDTPVGTQQTGGLNETNTLLEELNNELEAFSIHQDKLKLMSEDRKTTSQILNKRVNDENPKNFKKDLQHSGVKQVLDVEKELEWKDQQTDVDDPQKLGQDIEKKAIKTGDMKSDEALKNVGNSTNDDGDEVTKRNLTTKEQEEVNLYRNGLHSPIFDNEPDKRFEDRMKADMGEEIYDQRQKQIAFKGKAPMYNKDPQPIEDTTAHKLQFDKEQTGWNERMGIGNEKSLKESFVTGSFHNEIGKRHLIDFKLNEVSEINEEASKKLFKLDFTGLGNSYHSRTVDNKVVVNEAVVNAMNSHKFFTNGKEVFAMENPKQSINEGEVKEKTVVNEAQEKMKHLLGYDTKSYINTKNIKL